MKLYIYIYIYIHIKSKAFLKRYWKIIHQKTVIEVEHFLSSITRAPLDIDQVNLFEKVSSETDLYN